RAVASERYRCADGTGGEEAPARLAERIDGVEVAIIAAQVDYAIGGHRGRGLELTLGTKLPALAAVGSPGIQHLGADRVDHAIAAERGGRAAVDAFDGRQAG